MIFSLQNIRIQLRLLPAFRNISTAFFCLYHCQRFMTVIIQHIICSSFSRFRRHALKRILIDPVLSLCPSGIRKHGINIDLTSLIFGKVQRLRNIRLDLFFSLRCQFFFECFVLCDQCFQIYIRQHFLLYNFLFLF